jgi:hypothetical protein
VDWFLAPSSVDDGRVDWLLAPCLIDDGRVN